MPTDSNATNPKDITDYVGYIPDLMDTLSKRLGFDYEFYLSPDDTYGKLTSSGRWDGMIGEVQKWQVYRDTCLQHSSV